MTNSQGDWHLIGLSTETLNKLDRTKLPEENYNNTLSRLLLREQEITDPCWNCGQWNLEGALNCEWCRCRHPSDEPPSVSDIADMKGDEKFHEDR